MQTRRKSPALRLSAALALCVGLLALPLPVQAQQSDETTTFEDVQKEFSETFDTISEYTAQEREDALAAIDETLQRLDGRIEETEAAIRDQWSEMSQATREQTAATLKTLRERRNRLSEAVGALSQGAGNAWGDLMAGVRNGWNDLERAWGDAASTVDTETETGD
ncbi:MAG: hypothetical protein NXH84_02215 [Rhodobacteraceae bacterium]|nr:hypothetical protein [Paracoccaceae bacterium]